MNIELIVNHEHHQAREQERLADETAARVLAANSVEIGMEDHRSPSVILRDLIRKGLMASEVKVIPVEESAE